MDAGLLDVCNKCLDAEKVPLTAQDVRERVFNIGRVPKAVPEDDRLALKAGLAWLLGQVF